MYSGVRSILRRYWIAYGGWSGLIHSPYLHAALILLVLTFNSWMSDEWWDTVISVLPNLLGFTLGGFAIFIGFGDADFIGSLAEPEEDASKPTVYGALCATFVHFILVQVGALLYAVVAKSWWFYVDWPEEVQRILPFMNAVGGAVGYCLFLYALTSVLAATLHVFRIAMMYEKYQLICAKQRVENDEGE